MAKLSAYGRKKVFQFTKEYLDYSGDRVKQYYVIMTDGTVLKKHIVWIKAFYSSPSGYKRIDTGWKEWRKIKKGQALNVFVQLISRAKEQEFKIKDFRKNISESG